MTPEVRPALLNSSRVTGESPPPIAIRTVAIIGAGEAGRSFAIRCLRAGFDVTLEDVMPSNLRRAEAELIHIDPTHHTFSLALTVEDAVRTADLAIDFVPDELESKLEIFSMLDRMAPPKTILCTPTEALSITDLASCVYRPDRTVALQGLTAPAPVPTQTLGLLYPPSAAPATLKAMLAFLDVLGYSVTCEQDRSTPMLVKNLP